MPTLSEQLQHLQEIKAEFNEALKNAKALTGENIDSAVQNALDEKAQSIQSTLKTELLSVVEAQCTEKSEENKAFLFDECQKIIDERFLNALKNQQFLDELDDKAIEAVENKVEAKLKRFDMLNLQFKNATSCFKLCLQNELFELSEALKTIAQIEFYEQKLRENAVINKAYQVR